MGAACGTESNAQVAKSLLNQDLDMKKETQIVEAPLNPVETASPEGNASGRSVPPKFVSSNEKQKNSEQKPDKRGLSAHERKMAAYKLRLKNGSAGAWTKMKVEEMKKDEEETDEDRERKIRAKRDAQMKKNEDEIAAELHGGR